MKAAAGFRRTHCKTKNKSPVGKEILTTMEKRICTPNWKNKQTVHALRQRQKPDVPVHLSTTTYIVSTFYPNARGDPALEQKPVKISGRAPIIIAAGTPSPLANILLCHQRIA